MTLSAQQISKLEDCKRRSKQVFENYDEKFENYLKEQLKEVQKCDNSIASFNKEQMDDLKMAFNDILAEKSSKELYSEFPFEELWQIMGIAASVDPVTGVIFGAVNFLFNAFGLFNNQKKFFEQIMKAVEALIDKKMSEERARQCIIYFQQIQKTGDDYYILSEEFFNRRGQKSNCDNLISNEIKQMTDDLLSETIKIQLVLYRDKITDALIYFGEETELINTIGFYILTACQYLLLQRDCVKHGKEMGFSEFDIKDARSRIHSYITDFYEVVIRCGWKLTRHNGNEHLKFFTPPPYFDATKAFRSTDFTYYPLMAFDYRREPPNITYEIKDEKGSHLLGPNLLSGYTLLTNSMSSGFKGVKANGFNLKSTLIVKFPSIKKRSFKVKLHHYIVNEANWTISAGSVNKNLVFKQGTEGEKRNPYFVYNEDFSMNPVYGTNVSELITVETEQVTFTNNRSVDGGVQTGYKQGSILYLIELIFD